MKAHEFHLSRDEWIKLIDQWIFNERDRAMLKRRLLDGVIYEDLAEEFCLSVQTVKTRIYQAQKWLFRHI